MNGKLSIENLVVGRHQSLINAFSLELEAPNLIILSGRNGSGKSTLLKTLTGLIPAFSGHVAINGLTVSQKHQSELSKLVAFVNTDRVKEDFITVKELIQFGLHPWMRTNYLKDNLALVDEAIQLLGIDNIQHKYLNTISDGEWQKANIARALVQNTPLLMMDEPSAFLDYPSKKQLFSDLKNIAISKQKLIIVSSHDLDLANQFGTGFISINNQQLNYSLQPFLL